MKSKNHTKYDPLTEREEALSSEAPGASQGPVARSDPWEWGLEGHSTSPPQLRSPTRDPTHTPVLPCTFPGYSQNPAQLCRWICGTGSQPRRSAPAISLCSALHSRCRDAIPDQEPTGGFFLELFCPVFSMKKEGNGH